MHFFSESARGCALVLHQKQGNKPTVEFVEFDLQAVKQQSEWRKPEDATKAAGCGTTKLEQKDSGEK